MSGKSSKRIRRAVRGVIGEGVAALWDNLAALPLRGRVVLALRMLRGRAVDGRRRDKPNE
jgi:hypothetical protein